MHEHKRKKRTGADRELKKLRGDLLNPDRAVGDELGRTPESEHVAPVKAGPRERPAAAVDPLEREKDDPEGPSLHGVAAPHDRR